VKKLKKNPVIMTNSEEVLMGILWSSERPMTSVELMEMTQDHSWESGYIHKMLRSLLKKEIVKVCGIVQYGKQYARQFVPMLTKEEYAAKLALSTGIKGSSIGKVAAALAKETENSEELIEQLEEIIQQMKCGEPEETQQEE